MTSKTDKAAPKNKGGRPKTTVIDYAEVERLARFGCTQTEIANEIGIPLGTLSNDIGFKEAHKKGMDHVRMSVRRMQLALAAQGNATMLIWLGKNLLGQSDRPMPDDAEVGALDALAAAIEASRKKHNL